MHSHSFASRHAARTTILALVLALAPVPDSHAAAERIGIFDSRAVAYAFFWSEPGQKKRNDLMSAVRAAQASGDTAQVKRAETAIRAYDGCNHLAVFSTGPADDALVALGEQLPGILRDADVARLISKWDVTALAATGEAERVDVTDRLVAEFNLPPAKLRAIDELLKHEPVPLERARELWNAGKL